MSCTPDNSVLAQKKPMRDYTRVLLAEDSEEDYHLIHRMFAKMGKQRYSLNRVSTLPDAIKALQMDHDLLLLDYKLEEYEGVELIHEARMRSYRKPIVVITGYGDDYVMLGERMLMAGATDFISKDELTADLLDRVIRYAMIRKSAENRLRFQTTEDGLTQALNRGYFMSVAETEVLRSLRHRHSLSVLLIDVDYFKRVNDEHGHLAGDTVLKNVIERCRSCMRASDTIGRYGGDEFIILLPETDETGATDLGERMRRAVSDKEIRKNGDTIYVSISIGAAVMPQDSNVDNLHELLLRADNALLKAKQAGRNAIMVEKC